MDAYRFGVTYLLTHSGLSLSEKSFLIEVATQAYLNDESRKTVVNGNFPPSTNPVNRILQITNIFGEIGVGPSISPNLTITPSNLLPWPATHGDTVRYNAGITDSNGIVVGGWEKNDNIKNNPTDDKVNIGEVSNPFLNQYNEVGKFQINYEAMTSNNMPIDMLSMRGEDVEHAFVINGKNQTLFAGILAVRRNGTRVLTA